MTQSTKIQKKNRKYGRTERSPTHQRYNAQSRWIRNKAARVVRQLSKHQNYKPFNLSVDVKAYINKNVPIFKGRI